MFVMAMDSFSGCMMTNKKHDAAAPAEDSRIPLPAAATAAVQRAPGNPSAATWLEEHGAGFQGFVHGVGQHIGGVER